ncbi:MAG: nitrous oxide-stimulated promoter family protein [Microbacter sp.]
MSIEREQKTIKIMIGIYCHDHHHTSEGLCVECQQLADYALMRLQKCPFAPNKPTCKTCPVHCYRSGERERMRQVMRYAGPRMLRSHPLTAIQHLLNEVWQPKRHVGKRKH